MKLALALLLGSAACLFFQGCSGGSYISGTTLGGPEGGVPFGPDGGSSGGGDGSAASGSCISCPVYTYCDIATNTCRPGCVLDEECGQGEICDVQARTCRTAGTTGGSSSSGGSSSGTSGSSSGSSGTSGGSSGTSSSGSSGSSSGSSGGSSGSSGSSSGSSGGAPGVTWSQIFAAYLAAGTIGNCAKSGCHSQMSTAPMAYSWLSGKGYIAAANAPLADPSQSCLSWLGGNMPPGGPTANAAAASALSAWAAAGAPNN